MPVTTAEYNTIRDAMITAVNGGASQATAWATATAAVSADKPEEWAVHLGGLKPRILGEVNEATEKRGGISTPEIRRMSDLLAAGKTWEEAKAAFPRVADAVLEAHKAEAEAWAADHPQGYPTR